jgi:hypothetical protein
MKALLIPVALCAALAGCATYGDPYGYGYGYPAASVTYSTGGYYAPGYYGAYPVYRDRDRDGVPNRYDRDRDGDGVRNSRDIAPNNPRWR